MDGISMVIPGFESCGGSWFCGKALPSVFESYGTAWRRIARVFLSCFTLNVGTRRSSFPRVEKLVLGSLLLSINMVFTSLSTALPPTPPSEPVTSMENKNEVNGVMASSETEHRHIWLITGPAGCGKTSVAEFLHETYSLPYLEGDTVSECSQPPICHLR